MLVLNHHTLDRSLLRKFDIQESKSESTFTLKVFLVVILRFVYLQMHDTLDHLDSFLLIKKADDSTQKMHSTFFKGLDLIVMS